MPHQVGVTIRAPLREGHQAGVEQLLERVRDQGVGKGSLPFARMPAVHFARLLVFHEVVDLDGSVIPGSLVYMADVDGSARRHLVTLAHQAGLGIDELFSHCVGYPENPSELERVAWLEQHSERPLAYYVHAVGRTVRQIHDEARLHDEIGDLLDEQPFVGVPTTASGLRRQIVQTVVQRPHLAWSARRAAGSGITHRLRETAHLVVVPLVVTATLPLTAPVAVIGLVAIRLRERRDPVDATPADAGHVRRVQTYEDFGAQNPFTAVGFVKPGLLRRVTMQVALRGLDYACRHVYRTDNLAGVRSIHFARWVPIDGGRRLIFASSYDGSLESYMDDFIDRVHWGVNLVFSNGVGYPRTRWLIHGGARDEGAYKHHLRRRQVPTQVFYSAYDTLSAPNIDANSRIRSGVARAQDETDAGRWLAVL